MATIDVSGTTTAGHTSRRVNSPVYVREAYVDFEDVLAAKGSALAANDVVRVMDIAADTMVFGVGVDVVTAFDGATLTLDVGDGDDPDGYVDGADGTSTGNNFRVLTLTDGTPNTVTGYSAGKFYASSDTLDVEIATLSGTLDNGLIRVYAFVADVSDTVRPQSAKERDGLSLP